MSMSRSLAVARLAAATASRRTDSCGPGAAS
jgi:hypothetical protein